jgi:hypothetical protein
MTSVRWGIVACGDAEVDDPVEPGLCGVAVVVQAVTRTSIVNATLSHRYLTQCSLQLFIGAEIMVSLTQRS